MSAEPPPEDDTLAMFLKNKLVPRQLTQEDVDREAAKHNAEHYSPAERLAGEGVA